MVRLRGGIRKILILLKLQISTDRSKGNAIHVQAWRGLACSRRSSLPDFKTIGT